MSMMYSKFNESKLNRTRFTVGITGTSKLGASICNSVYYLPTELKKDPSVLKEHREILKEDYSDVTEKIEVIPLKFN